MPESKPPLRPVSPLPPLPPVTEAEEREALLTLARVLLEVRERTHGKQAMQSQIEEPASPDQQP